MAALNNYVGLIKETNHDMMHHMFKMLPMMSALIFLSMDIALFEKADGWSNATPSVDGNSKPYAMTALILSSITVGFLYIAPMLHMHANMMRWMMSFYTREKVHVMKDAEDGMVVFFGYFGPGCVACVKSSLLFTLIITVFNVGVTNPNVPESWRDFTIVAIVFKMLWLNLTMFEHFEHLKAGK